MEHGGDHTSIEQRVNASERARRVFELVKLGASYAAAGKEVGMTRVAARQAFLLELRGVPPPDAREWRKLQIERYSAALMDVNVYQAADPDKILECAKTKVRILNGLNDILGIKRLVLKVDEENAEQLERLTLAGLRIVWDSIKERKQEAAVEVTAEDVTDAAAPTESASIAQPTIEDLRKAGRNGNG